MKNKLLIYRLVLLLVIILAFSCESFLESDLPPSFIESSEIFEDDNSAISAMKGVYSTMYLGNNFASGFAKSVSSLAGLSADELINVPRNTIEPVEFDENNLTSENNDILVLWSSMYQIIYQVNSIVEGLDNSTNLSPNVKSQLKGESLFLRGFTHFYLMNLFGEVPLVLSTDYTINSEISRSNVSDIYDQIVLDLIEASELLSNEYVESPEKVRPNKFTALSFLSRVYLYGEDFTNAENTASLVISSGLYSLQSDLNLVFLKNSNEAIWQLSPATNISTGYTNEAFIFSSQNVLNFNALNSNLVNSFEDNDQRYLDWVNALDTGSEIIYYPYKYKQDQLSLPITEYSMIIRYAELFLIRSEARAKQGNLSGASTDLNLIRNRAGLMSLTGLTQQEILDAILHERQVELFTEWGHRWLDLKRTENAESILGILKPNFSETDQLYPIPQQELNNNPNLGGQNPGY